MSVMSQLGRDGEGGAGKKYRVLQKSLDIRDNTLIEH